jgi:phosphoribosylpyrophosphate synthetase
LIHSTESAENFVKLFLTLFALRDKGIEKISLINTYQGYARQEKETKDGVGEGISAISVLKVLNNFLDNNFAINIHYGKEEGIVELSPEIFIYKDGKKEVINKLRTQKVYNLTGFVQLSEHLIKSIPEDEITEEHPLILVAPDDGGYFQAEKAAEVLKQRYGLNVEARFLQKKRESAEEVSITEPGLYMKDKKGNDILVSYDDLNKHWILILDDETSTGGTILKAVYHLVKILDADWSKIMAGIVHWKVPQGSHIFDTGLWPGELKTAKLPKNIDDINKKMPPKKIITMRTLPIPSDVEAISPAALIAFAIKRILGGNIILIGG